MTVRPYARSCALLVILVIAAACAVTPTLRTSPSSSAALVERGRYLARIAGCNDCHTPGYPESGGMVAEDKWLIGDRLGWRGPWGTTYAINLRTYLVGVSEAEWVRLARTLRSRPPMPWFILRDMTDEDLRAIYQFVRSLGPNSESVPAFVPPGQEPPPPYVQFPEPPKPSR